MESFGGAPGEFLAILCTVTKLGALAQIAPSPRAAPESPRNMTVAHLVELPEQPLHRVPQLGAQKESNMSLKFQGASLPLLALLLATLPLTGCQWGQKVTVEDSRFTVAPALEESLRLTALSSSADEERHLTVVMEIENTSEEPKLVLLEVSFVGEDGEVETQPVQPMALNSRSSARLERRSQRPAKDFNIRVLRGRSS